MVYNFTPSVELLMEFMKEGALVFILVFSIVYFMLNKVRIFGEEEKSKRINIIVALALAIASVMPHFTNSYYGYGQTVDVVEIVNNALPSVSLLIIGVVLVLIVLSIFGFDKLVPEKASLLSGVIIIFAILSVLYIFLQSAGIWGTTDLFWWLSDDLKGLILIILIFGIVFYFATGKAGDKGLKGVLKDLLEDVTK